jgi:hypothetical protein
MRFPFKTITVTPLTARMYGQLADDIEYDAYACLHFLDP